MKKFILTLIFTAIVKLIFSQVIVVTVKSSTGTSQDFTVTAQSPANYNSINFDNIDYHQNDSIFIKNSYGKEIFKRNTGWDFRELILNNKYTLNDSLIMNNAKFKIQLSGDNIAYFFKLALQNIATGISDLKLNASKLTVFPNPTIDEVTVSFTALKEKTPIEIFDIQGRLVMLDETEREVGVNSVKLNVDALAKGIYTIKVDGNNLKLVK